MDYFPALLLLSFLCWTNFALVLAKPSFAGLRRFFDKFLSSPAIFLTTAAPFFPR